MAFVDLSLSTNNHSEPPVAHLFCVKSAVTFSSKANFLKPNNFQPEAS